MPASPLGGTGTSLTYLVGSEALLPGFPGYRWLTVDVGIIGCRRRIGLPVRLVHEAGCTLLDGIDFVGVLATGLGIDEVTGFADAVLDGFFVATNKLLSLAL